MKQNIFKMTENMDHFLSLLSYSLVGDASFHFVSHTSTKFSTIILNQWASHLCPNRKLQLESSLDETYVNFH